MPKWKHSSEVADVGEAQECMRNAFRRGCGLIDEVISELWTWDTIPARFEYDGPAWQQAETEILDAALKGHWWTVTELGDKYVARVQEYCDRWRERSAKKAGTAA